MDEAHFFIYDEDEKKVLLFTITHNV